MVKWTWLLGMLSGVAPAVVVPSIALLFLPASGCDGRKTFIEMYQGLATLWFFSTLPGAVAGGVAGIRLERRASIFIGAVFGFVTACGFSLLMLLFTEMNCAI